jgi:hypothetical protein
MSDQEKPGRKVEILDPVRTSVVLDSRKYQAARYLSKAQGKNFSSFLRDLVSWYLAETLNQYPDVAAKYPDLVGRPKSV